MVMQQAKQLLTEYQEGQASNVVSRGASKSNHTSWEPPPLVIYKVNWDAAVKHEIGRVGIGIVIRDFEGRVVASRSMQRYIFTDSYTAKSQGALQAIIFARDIGLRRIILEGDALQVIHSIKLNTSQFHLSRVLLWDVKFVLSHFDNWIVVHVRRNVNMAAQVLAKYA
ncbi:uncharacterized protein LOC121236613 [Juglans microcarpa x Juglans regia]|uniref:uncharacterized protein LOC121236613 n=1 Tax=Juglans microcarpa x Juglans regia TaxID=2249226 RepID=UPI001B7ED299|nr:uncharacterized protein LOC121236613 [Juglans microcarpa x Juglans regia]